MKTRVKICGITNLADAEAAVEAGADALGFILYSKSPRYVGPREAQRIMKQLPPFIERVAVVVNASDEDIAQIEGEATFSLWQLHGDESSKVCARLAPRRLVKALSLPTSYSSEELMEYGVDAFLLDTPSVQYGGTGKVFNWDLVADFRALTDQKIVLSGGITIENVVEAVRRVQPYAIDVSSGVESVPGKKDHNKLREFLEICKTL